MSCPIINDRKLLHALDAFRSTLDHCAVAQLRHPCNGLSLCSKQSQFKFLISSATNLTYSATARVVVRLPDEAIRPEWTSRTTSYLGDLPLLQARRRSDAPAALDDLLSQRRLRHGRSPLHGHQVPNVSFRWVHEQVSGAVKAVVIVVERSILRKELRIVDASI